MGVNRKTTVVMKDFIIMLHIVIAVICIITIVRVIIIIIFIRTLLC